MAYINKKLQNVIIDMDKSFSISLGVRNWVRKSIYPKHNLIIKSKKGYHCTNCHKEFYSTAKVYDYIACPKCKENLQVRKCTLQCQIFIDYFRILDYIDGCFVLRGFEVRSTYNNFKVNHHIAEYQRLVIDKDRKYLLLSNIYKVFLTTRSVWHNEKHTKWRLYDNYYSHWYYSRGSIYWGEIEGDLEGSIYQYCPMERGISTYTGTDDIEDILQRVLESPVSSVPE